MKKTLQKSPNIILRGIRFLLFSSLVLNIIVSILILFGNNFDFNVLFDDEAILRYELFLLALATLVLTYLPSYAKKHKIIDLPDIIEAVIVLFIFAGIYLSANLDLYYKYFWWDDVLHTLAGVIIAVVGFLLIYKLNYKYRASLSPFMVAIFTFSFALSMGVLWEILEFMSDVFFVTAHQKWDLPDSTILMGKPYQGSGLRDTMSDLILTAIGAFVISIFSYFVFKHGDKKLIKKIDKYLSN